MEVGLKDVFNFSEVDNDYRKVFDAVDKDSVAVILKGGKPKYVVVPYTSTFEIDNEELVDWSGSAEDLEEINRVNEELLEDLTLENNPVF